MIIFTFLFSLNLSSFAELKLNDLIKGRSEPPVMSPAANGAQRYREHMEKLKWQMNFLSKGRSYGMKVTASKYTLPSGVEMSRGINSLVSAPVDFQCAEVAQNDVPSKRDVREKDDKKEKVEKRKLTNSPSLFSAFSNSQGVDDMIDTLKKNSSKCLAGEKNAYICKREKPTDRKAERKATGYCFRYVKLAVMDGGYTDVYPGGESAKYSGAQWKSMGFRNLLEESKYKKMTAYDAPKGAILVYSGGNYGHVEVKASENEYISDYIGKKPIYDELGLPRKLIGVYVR